MSETNVFIMFKKAMEKLIQDWNDLDSAQKKEMAILLNLPSENKYKQMWEKLEKFISDFDHKNTCSDYIQAKRDVKDKMEALKNEM